MKYKIIEMGLLITNIVLLLISFLNLRKLSILPLKYLIIVEGIFLFLLLISIIIFFINEKINIVYLVFLLLIVIFTTNYINTTYSFINNNFSNEYIPIKPFNVYISGSDSRKNDLDNNSRSDVNMIVTVNPEKHKIILTSIPRDYYVNVGNNTYKEKLTNIGVLGINNLKISLENLLSIKIDYYIKVGFDGLVDLIDVINGIDIYNDVRFKSSVSDKIFEEGNIHLNGEETLLYVRERKSFNEGDIKRVSNHQIIIKAIINKVNKNKSLLLKYNQILKKLDGKYRTDIPKNIITDLISECLIDHNEWEIEQIVLIGEGTKKETYLSKSKKYVIVPDADLVRKTGMKITYLIDN